MANLINKKRIALNTFFLYSKTIITMLIALYSTRLILDGLGNMDFGIYGSVGGAIVMLEALNIAMAQATQRFMNYSEGAGDKQKLLFIFNNSAIIHLGLGLAIVLLLLAFYYPLFNGIFCIPDDRVIAAKSIYLFLVFSTFFTIITVPYDALINAHENFLYYSVVGIIVAVLKLLAAFAVIWWYSDKLILYGFLMALISVVNMLIMRIYCKRKYAECSFLPRKYADRKIMREIGSFASWNFVGALATIFGNHGSTILMNHFFGPILIAAKNIGDQVCSQVSILTSNMTKALNPVIMKLEGGGDREAMINLTLASCRYSFFLYMIVAAPFLMNTEYLLRFWLHKVPAWAVLFCQLQVIRTLFEQLFTPLRTALVAQGSIKSLNLSELVLGILTLGMLGIFYYLGAQPAWHYYISIALLVFVSGGIKVYLGARKCNLSIKKYVKSVIIRIVLYCGVLTLYYKLWNYWKITDTIYSLAFQFVIIVFISGCFALSQDAMKLIKKYFK
jgi:O-antigen/teichoic acid export membrane protein